MKNNLITTLKALKSETKQLYIASYIHFPSSEVEKKNHPQAPKVLTVGPGYGS